MDTEIRQAFYDTYTKWKEWEAGDGYLDRSDVFIKELGRTNIPTNARILEIGFGEGLFLDWAKSQGFKPIGIETIPELVSSGGITWPSGVSRVFPRDLSRHSRAI